jgi:hypothetical protein
MIIKFPTGFYETVLPQEPQDGGNVTFTISNNPPPRTNLVFPKIPPGIVDRKREPKTIELLDRRDVVGDLVFTVSRSSRSVEGSNNREFETGQVLEFSDAPLQTLEPMLVGEATQTQHDTNRLNYDALGVDEEEQQLIADSSLIAHKNLAEQLNIARQQRANAEQEVTAQQKIINDSNRALRALESIQDSTAGTDSDVTELIQKLQLKRDEAFVARDTATGAANAFADEANRLVDEIRNVSTVLT